MAMALHDPDDGYYARRAPIGARGDFVTAPEISQVFGELIGLWCAVVWDQLGRPDPVILAELGPGRGVLMSDLLRAAATVPNFRRALRLHLVEASAPLCAVQKQRLARFAPVWVSRFEELPDGPMLLVANEFLDALPVRQFVRHGAHWSERMVTLDDENRFVFVEGPRARSVQCWFRRPCVKAPMKGKSSRFARRPSPWRRRSAGAFGAGPGRRCSSITGFSRARPAPRSGRSVGIARFPSWPHRGPPISARM